ncbi:MAG: Ig-like domain-containing protein [Spirochaetes bacterium]|nr:Ig-like domain-containing protein [Spirochaetota bacterium]MBU1081136.1 Ig-like domain-containing protein [Spirochaetota bacterium]
MKFRVSAFMAMACLAIVALLTSCPPPVDPNGSVAVSGVSLDKSSLSLTVSATGRLTATVSPAEATDASVAWSSSAEAIASVSAEGLVTAKAAGSATITVTTTDGAKTASCAVTVTSAPVAVTGVSVNKPSTTILVGATEQLSATVSPAEATDASVTWSSSSDAVASVSAEGLVTAKAAGSATITVTTTDGAKTASCVVTVTSAPVAVISVRINKPSTVLLLGDSEQLTAITSPTDATNQSVLWSSSAEGVATVSASGLVSAISAGSAVITAKTVDGGYLAECSITVSATAVPVTGVTLNKSDVTIAKGATRVLIATINPSGATNQNLAWSSSAESVVTVSDAGIVSALAVGNAVITVRSADGGLTATCAVTVNVPELSVELNTSAATIARDYSQRLVATVLPADASDKNVTWSSSDIGVAMVDSDGLVKAIKTGTATITATSASGKTVTCEVTVITPVTGVSLDKTSAILSSGNALQLTASIAPFAADTKTCAWTSSAAGVATVSANGLVTAVSAGDAIITVQTDDGGKTASCAIHVIASGVSFTFTGIADEVIDLSGSEVNYIYKSSSPNSFTATVAGSYTSIVWYFDGSKRTTTGSSCTVTAYDTDSSIGVHTLMAIVSNGSQAYSKSVKIRVENRL